MRYNEIRPSATKTVGVQRFLESKCKKSLRRFLGPIDYFRKFIRDYANVVKPLSDILKKAYSFQECISERV